MLAKRHSFPSYLAMLLKWLLLLQAALFSQKITIPQDAWQEIGEPFIRNYTPKEYGADFQNWGIAQDTNGVMYFANNDGLLEYDGVSWRLHKLGAYSALRSIAAGDDGKIYAGLEAGFGYFEPGKNGDLKFTALDSLVDEKYGDYYDFWFTLILDEAVYFMSQQLLFRWENEVITVIKPKGELTHAFIVNGELYFDEPRSGLSRLVGDRLEIVADMMVVDRSKSPFLMYPYDTNSILIGTYNDGFYLYDHSKLTPFPAPATDFLKRHRIYTFAVLPNDMLAVGTQFGGLAIIDHKANLYKVIDKKTGLQDNSVWYVYPDKEGGLWLALNKGISRVELLSPLSRFSANSGLGGIIEQVYRHKGTIYAATSEGIRYLDKEVYYQKKNSGGDTPKISNGFHGQRPVFRTIEGLNQYGFCFLAVEDDLLAGMNAGIFLVKGNTYKQILEDFTGGWQSVFALHRSKKAPNQIYAGTRRGIGLLKYNGGKFESMGWVKDLFHKFWALQEDKHGALWATSIQSGITRIENIADSPVEIWKFPAKVTRFDQSHGLPDEPVSPLIVHDQLVFQSSQGVWRFDEENQKFYPDTALLGKGMKATPIEYHGRLDDRNQWWLSLQNKQGRQLVSVGVPDAKKTFQWQSRPFLRIHDATNILHVFPENLQTGNNIAWISSESLFRYDDRIVKNYTADYPVRIRRVTVEDDSIIFSGHGKLPAPALAHDENALRFEYAAASYNAASQNQFRTRLEGFDKKWSAWSHQTQRDYTNLPPGEYRFLVEAKNVFGHPGKAAAYLFDILVPWYLSWWMYLIYALLIGGGIFALVQFRVRHLKRKSKELEDIVFSRTEQVVAQRNRLKAQSEKLQEMDKLKSRFFANISHEFRTPLTLILGLVRKFKQNSNKAPAASDYDVIHRNAARLLQLINQLLDLAKLEAGGIKLQAGKDDVVRFLRRISASFMSMGEQKQIDMTFNGAPISQKDGHPAVFTYFDQDKLEKVFYNLLSNALKFTPVAGKVGVEVAVGSDDEDAGKSMINVQVYNTGPGIPAEKLPYIFDRFYQADGGTTREFEGTGIGLALVKELVELHHGDIQVESTPGEKTVFTVQLPMGRSHLRADEIIAEDSSEAKLAPLIDEAALVSKTISVESKPSENGEAEKTLILVVEDHPDLRVFISDHLSESYRVIAAENGRVGVEKAQELIPDLIISDIMMPEMDGYQLCDKVKSNEKTNHIPVILLTAKAAHEDKLEGLETGADDYLVKPFDPEELRVRVRNLIKTRQKMREKFSTEMMLKPREVNVPSAQQKFLERLVEVIEEHIDDESFSVEILGEEIGMSRVQLHRKLKAMTNRSPSEFIRNFRLQRAADLIKQDAGNIAEIAYMVGFNSQAYFTRCFQEVYGCSPSAYRKQHQ